MILQLLFYLPVIVHFFKPAGRHADLPSVIGCKFDFAGDWVYFGYFPRFVFKVDAHPLLRKAALLFAVKVVFVEKAAKKAAAGAGNFYGVKRKFLIFCHFD